MYHPAFKDSTIAEDVERRKQEQARQHVSERSRMERQEGGVRNADVVDPESLERQELERKFAEGVRVASQQTADRLAREKHERGVVGSAEQQGRHALLQAEHSAATGELAAAHRELQQNLAREEYGRVLREHAEMGATDLVKHADMISSFQRDTQERLSAEQQRVREAKERERREVSGRLLNLREQQMQQILAARERAMQRNFVEGAEQAVRKNEEAVEAQERQRLLDEHARIGAMVASEQHARERSGMERQEDDARNASVIGPESLARQELEHKFAEGARIAEQQTADRLAQERQDAQSRSSGDEQKHYAGVPPPPQLSLAEQQQTQEITRREKRQEGERKMAGFQEKLNKKMMGYTTGMTNPLWGGTRGKYAKERTAFIQEMAEKIEDAYKDRGIELSEAQQDAVVQALETQLDSRKAKVDFLTSYDADDAEKDFGRLKADFRDPSFLANLDAQARAVASQAFDPAVLEEQAVRGLFEKAAGDKEIDGSELDKLMSKITKPYDARQVARVANNIGVLSKEDSDLTVDNLIKLREKQQEVDNARNLVDVNNLAAKHEFVPEEERMSAQEIGIVQAQNTGKDRTHPGYFQADQLTSDLAEFQTDGARLAYIQGLQENATSMPQATQDLLKAYEVKYQKSQTAVESALEKRNVLVTEFKEFRESLTPGEGALKPEDVQKRFDMVKRQSTPLKDIVAQQDLEQQHALDTEIQRAAAAQKEYFEKETRAANAHEDRRSMERLHGAVLDMHRAEEAKQRLYQDSPELQKAEEKVRSGQDPQALKDFADKGPEQQASVDALESEDAVIDASKASMQEDVTYFMDRIDVDSRGKGSEADDYVGLLDNIPKEAKQEVVTRLQQQYPGSPQVQAMQQCIDAGLPHGIYNRLQPGSHMDNFDQELDRLSPGAKQLALDTMSRRVQREGQNNPAMKENESEIAERQACLDLNLPFNPEDRSSMEEHQAVIAQMAVNEKIKARDSVNKQSDPAQYATLDKEVSAATKQLDTAKQVLYGMHPHLNPQQAKPEQQQTPRDLLLEEINNRDFGKRVLKRLTPEWSDRYQLSATQGKAMFLDRHEAMRRLNVRVADNVNLAAEAGSHITRSRETLENYNARIEGLQARIGDEVRKKAVKTILDAGKPLYGTKEFDEALRKKREELSEPYDKELKALRAEGFMSHTGPFADPIVKMQKAYDKMIEVDAKHLRAVQANLSVNLEDQKALDNYAVPTAEKWNEMTAKEKREAVIAYEKAAIASNGKFSRMTPEEFDELPKADRAEIKLFEHTRALNTNITEQEEAAANYRLLQQQAKENPQDPPSAEAMKAAQQRLEKAKSVHIQELSNCRKAMIDKMDALVSGKESLKQTIDQEAKRDYGSFFGKIVSAAKRSSIPGLRDKRLKELREEQKKLQEKAEKAQEHFQDAYKSFLSAAHNFKSAETKVESSLKRAQEAFDEVIPEPKLNAREQQVLDKVISRDTGQVAQHRQNLVDAGLGGQSQMPRFMRGGMQVPDQQQAPPRVPQQQPQQHAPMQGGSQYPSAPGSAMGSRDTSMRVPSSGQRSPEPWDDDMSKQSSYASSVASPAAAPSGQSPYGGTPTTERAAAGGGDRHSGRSDSRASERTQAHGSPDPRRMAESSGNPSTPTTALPRKPQQARGQEGGIGGV